MSVYEAPANYSVARSPHASFCQEELMIEYGIDYVISGEWEFTFFRDKLEIEIHAKSWQWKFVCKGAEGI